MQRDTYKYELKNGNKVEYVGITNDPQRREAEHRQNKNFDKMEIIGRVSTRESAEQWETNRIGIYKRNHSGELPKYNQTTTGK
jgi:predicted GIY-YIG superfamily endonuclease